MSRRNISINLISLSLLTTLRNSSSKEVVGENFNWNKAFRHLLPSHPTVILLDSKNSLAEVEVRDALMSLDQPGRILSTFNPSGNSDDRRRQLAVVPKFGVLKSIDFRWSFVCLIESKRDEDEASIYLKELLELGHGREDYFILVGKFDFISKFLENPVIHKFKNVMGLSTDNQAVHQRKLGEYFPLMKSEFRPTNEIESANWIASRTISLSGEHLRISGTKFPPYLDALYEDGKRVIRGVNFRIFTHGAQRYNYTFELNHESEWKPTGRKHKNGTWDGVFGDILYDRADIASVSTQTDERDGLADFVGPFGRAHLIFVTSPGETYLGRYAILQAYTLDVWTIILLLFILFVTLFFKGFQLDLLAAGRKQPIAGNLFTKVVLTSLALTFEQTVEKRPKSIRFLMIIWVIFVVIIGTGYRSNLAAYMTTPQPESKPRTFQELDKALDYAIYFDLSGISAYIHFQESNASVIKNVMGRALPTSNTTECVIRAFYEPKTVCIGWDFTLKLAATRNMSISQLVDPLQQSESVWAAWYTFALQKNSVFTDAFQLIGEKCFESGLTGYWRNLIVNIYRANSLKWSRFFNNTGLTEKLMRLRGRSRSEEVPLKVENFEMIFLILVAGIGISVVCFLLEMITARVTSKRKIYRQKKISQCRLVEVKTFEMVP